MTEPAKDWLNTLMEPQPAGPVSRFLWYCAGADARLLERCPNSDRVKFQGMGGIVLATAVLAFASSSYAFYTVFSPKDDTALNLDLDRSTVLVSMGLGLVWALIIFNLDRFIISGTGKGDGTESITFSEFTKSIPRLIMAIIIGVTMSKPLEIRILQSEIEAQLELEQNEYLAQLNELSERNVESRRAELRGRMDAAQKRLDDRAEYFERRRLEIKEQRRLLELEAEGKSGTNKAGRGPAWRDKKETLDKMEIEIGKDQENDKAKAASLEAEMGEWKKELNRLDERLQQERASNVKQARHLDGLMKRIQISHDIGGSIPWWILLLLLAIETGPIFFKMMLIRGAYDYIDENLKKLAVARVGVEVEGRVFTVEGNREVRVDVFHQVEASLAEEKRRLQSEATISKTVHEEFQKKETEKVRQDPSRYISSS